MPSVDAEHLVAGLRSGGMRVTRPRRAVCEALADGHDDHLTATALHADAERLLGSTIDMSTIYRTIDALETAGMVHHVHLGHGPAVLHLSGHLEHHHLTCEVCDATVDLSIEEMRELTDRIVERHGFIVDSAHFGLVGRCAAHRDDSSEND